MSGVTLFGWDGTNKVWLPVLVDALGNLKVDMSGIVLDDLGNVDVPSPADKYLLYFDAATSLWKCKALADMDAIAKSVLTEQGSIIFRNPTVPAELLHGTAGQLLQSGGHDANPSWATPAVTLLFFVVSEVLQLANDTERNTASLTYTKVKESRVCYGALRIKFDLRSYRPAGGLAYAKIYRNGVAVGTERTNTEPYATFTEDLSGWLLGDLCQIYAHIEGYASELAYVKNFRIYGTGEDSWKAIT